MADPQRPPSIVLSPPATSMPPTSAAASGEYPATMKAPSTNPFASSSFSLPPATSQPPGSGAPSSPTASQPLNPYVSQVVPQPGAQRPQGSSALMADPFATASYPSMSRSGSHAGNPFATTQFATPPGSTTQPPIAAFEGTFDPQRPPQTMIMASGSSANMQSMGQSPSGPPRPLAPGSFASVPPGQLPPTATQSSQLPPTSGAACGAPPLRPALSMATMTPSTFTADGHHFDTRMDVAGPAPFPQGNSMMATASGSGAPIELKNVVTVQITRLLDMPVKNIGKNVFGQSIYKGLHVRAYDSEMRELDRTRGIAVPLAAKDPTIETETVDVPPSDGILELSTRSKVIYLQVEFIDLVGTRPIGKCKIHRMDPRSSQIWPYVLSNQYDKPVNCGIELRVAEGPREQLRKAPPQQAAGVPGTGNLNAAPPTASALPPTAFPPMGSMGSVPTVTMPPMMSGMPPPMMPGPPPMMTAGPPPMMLGTGPPPTAPANGSMHAGHGLVGLLHIDSVKDMPAPVRSNLNQVMLTFYADNESLNGGAPREVKKAGPFSVLPQGVRRDKQLYMADCLGQRAVIKAPLNFGGRAREGAMYLKIGVTYQGSNPSQGVDAVGMTMPITVSFDEQKGKYYELRLKSPPGVTGGITLTHRLVPEAEIDHLEKMAAGAKAGGIEIGPPVEIPFNVSGRSGVFPPFSPEEAMECAAQNTEVQNRALLQRCKMADAKGEDTSGMVQTVNGYRQWADLDSLFATMGPSPLAMSEEVGANLVRGYQEQTCALKELGPLLGPNASPHDSAVNEELLRQVCAEDPRKPKTMVRPVVCKNPDEIMVTKDMRWLPDPPAYVLTKNLSPQDRETLRLSCHDPSQCAKLNFLDVNPNYQMSEDIWSSAEDYRSAAADPIMRPLGWKPQRVKDECLMA